MTSPPHTETERSSRPGVRRLIGRAGPATRGPRLIVTGGVHGNERAGVAAARRVIARLAAMHEPDLGGSMTALAGNLGALNHADPTTRYIHADLNRVFVPSAESLSTHDPCAELVERRELLDAIDAEIDSAPGPCVLLDLHTTSADSPPFVAMEDSLAARKIVRHLPLPVILGMEEELVGLLFDYVSNTRGLVAFIAEGGSHDDPASIDLLEAVIWTTLHAIGVIDLDDRDAPLAAVDPDTDPRHLLRKAAGVRARAVYDVRHREPVLSDYRTHPDRRAFERVARARTRIGVQDGRDVLAPTSGLLFMPNRQTHIRPGDDAFFVVREVSRGWLNLSARLRSSERVHRWIPRLLPGVRRRPGRPEQLLVAPEVAAVLRRQVLHLFGYRLTRFTPIPHQSPARRALGAFGASAQAFITLLRGAFRGGERAALPEERDTDWIVSRRALDLRPPPPPPDRAPGAG